MTASSQRMRHEEAESEPSEMDSTRGSSGRAASSVKKSSSAWPKPKPSSVDEDVFVFDTSVDTFRPNALIICVSRLPSPQFCTPPVIRG